jgi:hypothetical protein
MTHPFLSDEWMAAAREIRGRYADRAPEPPVSVKVNLVTFDVPFGDGEVKGYFDSSSGRVVLELGELDDADATVTTDYDTAKAIFVDQDPAVAMEAFMGGRIKIQGDMMKLMAMQAVVNPDDEVAAEVAREIRAITS